MAQAHPLLGTYPPLQLCLRTQWPDAPRDHSELEEPANDLTAVEPLVERESGAVLGGHEGGTTSLPPVEMCKFLPGVQGFCREVCEGRSHLIRSDLLPRPALFTMGTNSHIWLFLTSI